MPTSPLTSKTVKFLASTNSKPALINKTVTQLAKEVLECNHADTEIVFAHLKSSKNHTTIDAFWIALLSQAEPYLETAKCGKKDALQRLLAFVDDVPINLKLKIPSSLLSHLIQITKLSSENECIRLSIAFLQSLVSGCQEKKLELASLIRKSDSDKTLASILRTCGDYETQYSIFELLYRYVPKVGIASLFADMATTIRSLNGDNFIANVRLILNHINEKIGIVKSVECQSLDCGIDPNLLGMENFWLDINNESISCTLFMENKSFCVDIKFTSILAWKLERTSDRDCLSFQLEHHISFFKTPVLKFYLVRKSEANVKNLKTLLSSRITSRKCSRTEQCLALSHGTSQIFDISKPHHSDDDPIVEQASRCKINSFDSGDLLLSARKKPQRIISDDESLLDLKQQHPPNDIGIRVLESSEKMMNKKDIIKYSANKTLEQKQQSFKPVITPKSNESKTNSTHQNVGKRSLKKSEKYLETPKKQSSPMVTPAMRPARRATAKPAITVIPDDEDVFQDNDSFKCDIFTDSTVKKSRAPLTPKSIHTTAKKHLAGKSYQKSDINNIDELSDPRSPSKCSSFNLNDNDVEMLKQKLMGLMDISSDSEQINDVNVEEIPTITESDHKIFLDEDNEENYRLLPAEWQENVKKTDHKIIDLFIALGKSVVDKFQRQDDIVSRQLDVFKHSLETKKRKIQDICDIHNFKHDLSKLIKHLKVRKLPKFGGDDVETILFKLESDAWNIPFPDLDMESMSTELKDLETKLYHSKRQISKLLKL